MPSTARSGNSRKSGRSSRRPSGSGARTAEAAGAFSEANLVAVLDLLRCRELDEIAGFRIDLGPVVDIEVDHRDSAGRELAREVGARLRLALAAQPVGEVGDAGVVADQ